MSLNSRIPKFYSFSQEERRNIIASMFNFNEQDLKYLQDQEINDSVFEVMIENTIGKIPFPIGIATNFKINGKDYLIPMVIEESSVVAAASHAAKIARKKGGFTAEYSGSIVIGQIQLLTSEPFEAVKQIISSNKKKIIEIANSTNEFLVKLGGGAKDIEIRRVKGDLREYFILHLIVDTKDAMGANAVNTMLEKLQPFIESIVDCKVLLRILSNYAIKRIVKVKATFDKELLGGDEVVENILFAYDFAKHDVFRAVTHNKGIMNGITAVMLATGNDTRAIEAGAHAYASKDGNYSSLSKFEKDENGDLVGYLELPLSVGIVGGAIHVHPTYKTLLKILNVSTAEELAIVAGSVGLAQNLAAIRALASEGIQAGHMSLHARNLAVSIGAKGEEMEKVASKLIELKEITYDKALEILKKIRK
ncbi:MAG: hydroxymethylglutaryl-CoA reductase, degradative [Candidatus Heimdallarchaeum endolithica]|uniref:3-hydroxy-3-methylglutaryl coenzyme A reductase n=1 Tax=Candidatus Heimdallarchaeum endolithica TaxID=2876572 RepID=A0A9Y1FP64_9ARCH|nr:MAG: hydroxymethylglutaryl-CoA reductase, degradative [Candidatus Heimdallarchaeum endolithica]